MGTKAGSRPARRARAAPRPPDPRRGRMLALSAAVLAVLGAMAAVVFVASRSGDEDAAKGMEPQARAYVGGTCTSWRCYPMPCTSAGTTELRSRATTAGNRSVPLVA